MALPAWDPYHEETPEEMVERMHAMTYAPYLPYHSSETGLAHISKQLHEIAKLLERDHKE